MLRAFYSVLLAVSLAFCVAFAILPGRVHAETISFSNMVTTSAVGVFPIYVRSWPVPDGAVFTGVSGSISTNATANSFNVALMRVYLKKGGACPSRSQNEYFPDFGPLFAQYPDMQLLASFIIKSPVSGAVSLPTDFTIPGGVPISNCVITFISGSNIFGGGLYTMNHDMVLHYETGAAASALTKIAITPLDDEQCFSMSDGCGPYHTPGNTLSFALFRKVAEDKALVGLHGNVGTSALSPDMMMTHFGGSIPTGAWSVTDDFYIIPDCSALPSGRQAAGNWYNRLPSNAVRIYTKTMHANRIQVVQEPVNKTFSPALIVPRGGCLAHLIKRTGDGSLDAETQVLAFVRPARDAAFVSQTVPGTMVAGQTYPVTLTFKNTGTAVWATSTERLGSMSPANNTNWRVARAMLPGPVAPGETVSITFNVRATTTPGTYDFQWQMVRTGVGRFGDLSANRRITVTAAPPDTTPPTVAFIAPADNATVSGIVSVSATSSDNVGTLGVQFKLDDQNLGAEDTAAPYVVGWDTGRIGNGMHTLTAVAHDAAGNRVTATRTVNVLNARPAPTAIPAAGSYAETQRVALVAASSTSIRYTLNGTVPSCATGNVYSTPLVVAVSKTVKAVGCYTAGPSPVATFSYVIASSADRTPPTVAFIAPAANATISNTVSVSATSSDNVATVGVQFKIDGTDLGTEDTAAPYTIGWNTATVANGVHALTVVARDATGNRATSTRSVAVHNTVSSTPARTPLYAFHTLDAYNTHFYTASATEKAGLEGSAWHYDAIVAYLFAAQNHPTSTVPLYRLYRTSGNTHYYTSSAAEKDAAIASGYRYEGIVGYVYSAAQTGTVPLYRSQPAWYDYVLSTQRPDTANTSNAGHVGYTGGGAAAAVVVGHVFLRAR